MPRSILTPQIINRGEGVSLRLFNGSTPVVEFFGVDQNSVQVQAEQYCGWIRQELDYEPLQSETRRTYNRISNLHSTVYNFDLSLACLNQPTLYTPTDLEYWRRNLEGAIEQLTYDFGCRVVLVQDDENSTQRTATITYPPHVAEQLRMYRDGNLPADDWDTPDLPNDLAPPADLQWFFGDDD